AYTIEDLGTYTYENGVLTLTDKNGKTSSGEGDPIKLHYTYSDSEQLTGDYTIPASVFTAPDAEAPAEETAVEAEVPAEGAPIAEPVTVKSDDEGTEMTFNPDGTYRFFFSAYTIEDLGTYAFENGVLTLTDKNGKTSVGEGDPIKLHYTYSDSEQLTGDYTIPASVFAAPAQEAPAEEVPAAETPAEEVPAAETPAEEVPVAETPAEEVPVAETPAEEVPAAETPAEEAPAEKAPAEELPAEEMPAEEVPAEETPAVEVPAEETPAEEETEADVPAAEPVTIKSDDEATEITFNPDGTYRFFFSAYNVEDLGTYTFENGILTLTNANGVEAVAEGDPLKLHYVTAVSDQLAGDYTIPAETFAFTSEAAASVTVKSDDEATEITFNPDGTYRFFFSAYNVEDLGTYTYENGILTLTNANGVEAVAEGNPLKLHYVTAVSDQLSGDYTIAPETFSIDPAQEVPAV
ncbi:MAG: hypothetical protein IJI38_01135, partial [Clostridia bacterium]|nr:hypothetical protein [Clostridia bacterium]